METRRKTRRTAEALLAAALCTVVSTAQAAEELKLGKPYKDAVNGFALRPPADAAMERPPSSTRLVTWAQRDRKTGAIRWTFSVLRVPQPKKVTDLRKFAAELTTNLKEKDKFQVESVRFAPVGRKQTIHIRAETPPPFRRWVRQVWVQVGPEEFLVFVISGQPTEKQQLDSYCDTILRTVELLDPEAERASREAALKRGAQFLKSLTEKKFAAAVQSEPYWCLMRLKDKNIGFMLVTECAGSRAGLKGFEVKSWAMVQPPADKVRLMKRVLFTTPDRLLEQWKEHVQVGDGKEAEVISEQGMMTNGRQIVCDMNQGGKTLTHRKQVPQGVYLPRATAMLLPRLVDLKTPATYGFATYATKNNSYDYRTFTIVGPQRTRIGGKEVEAIRVVDKIAEDAQPTTLWLDRTGRLLRMEGSGEFIMEPADKKDVLRRFPKAEGIIRAMGK